MRDWLIPGVVLALLMGPAVYGSIPERANSESEGQVGIEHFQLYNHCRALSVLVERLPDDAQTIGLTEDAVHALTESRLRADSLYTVSRDAAVLYITVQVIHVAYFVRVELKKRMEDLASETQSYATAWESSAIGTHAGDGNYVLAALALHVEEFAARYARVNGAACARRSPGNGQPGDA